MAAPPPLAAAADVAAAPAPQRHRRNSPCRHHSFRRQHRTEAEATLVDPHGPQHAEKHENPRFAIFCSFQLKTEPDFRTELEEQFPLNERSGDQHFTDFAHPLIGLPDIPLTSFLTAFQGRKEYFAAVGRLMRTIARPAGSEERSTGHLNLTDTWLSNRHPVTVILPVSR